jgi:hypothetical protein
MPYFELKTRIIKKPSVRKGGKAWSDKWKRE